jgi:hypothetical protein
MKTGVNIGFRAILTLVMDHLGCLFEPPDEDTPGRYRIVNSETYWSFGNAAVDLESDVMRIQLFWDST